MNDRVWPWVVGAVVLAAAAGGGLVLLAAYLMGQLVRSGG